MLASGFMSFLFQEMLGLGGAGAAQRPAQPRAPMPGGQHPQMEMQNRYVSYGCNYAVSCLTLQPLNVID